MLAGFFRRDLLETVMRSIDIDDPVSMRRAYVLAVQSGRSGLAERVLELAGERRISTAGWREMLPEKFNTGERRIRRRREESVRGGNVVRNEWGDNVEVPEFLYRGSNDQDELLTIPEKGFMVATTIFSAKEYGRWVAVYAFKGGIVRFGFSSVLSKFTKDLGGGASSWHHETDRVACGDYRGDLYLSAGGDEEGEHAVVCSPKTLKLIEIIDTES